jgi:hypothetical protein
MSRTIHVVPPDVADPRPRGLAPSRLRHPGPGELGHEDVLLRLALWLADVAAEGALAVTTPVASFTRRVAAPPLGSADESSVAESAP